MSMQSTSYLYRPVIKKSWQIIRSFPHLWVFGLLAIIFSIGSEYEILLRSVYNSGRTGLINAFLEGVNSGLSEGSKLANQNFWVNSWNIFVSNAGSAMTALFIFALVITLVLVFIWLSISSQVALIRNVALIDKGKKASLAEGFEFAVSNFWPVLAIVIILKALLLVMFGLLELVFGAVSGLGWAADVIYIAAFIIFVGLALILAFLLKYQLFYLILKKQGFKESLKSGWRLFAANWLISLETAALMLLVFLASIVISGFLISVFFAIPIFIIPYYFSIWPVALKISVSMLSLLAVVATAVFVNSFVSVFQWSVWTVLFQKLEGGQGVSGLERVSAGLKQLPGLVMNRK